MAKLSVDTGHCCNIITLASSGCLGEKVMAQWILSISVAFFQTFSRHGKGRLKISEADLTSRDKDIGDTFAWELPLPAWKRLPLVLFLWQLCENELDVVLKPLCLRNSKVLVLLPELELPLPNYCSLNLFFLLINGFFLVSLPTPLAGLACKTRVT